MKLRHIGYACINVQIDLTTNRTFRLAKLSEDQARQTAAVNFAALQEILKWNVQHGIRLFRIGSSIIPFASHEQFTLDWASAFAGEIATIRQYVKDNGLRLSMHPGQYTVLNSPNPKTLADSVREIEWQTRLVSELDPEQGVAVLHIGGAYGDKEKAIDRFAEHFHRYLSDTARSRLVIENDDVTFTLDDVLSLHEMTGSPSSSTSCTTRPTTRRRLDRKPAAQTRTGGGFVAGQSAQGAPLVAQGRLQNHPRRLHRAARLRGTALLDGPTGQPRPLDVMIEAQLQDNAVQALSCDSFPTRNGSRSRRRKYKGGPEESLKDRVPTLTPRSRQHVRHPRPNPVRPCSPLVSFLLSSGLRSPFFT
jgi:sugar phosphate isomerase/epimerase